MLLGDLYQYQTNTQNQVNRMIGNMARKQARIGVLVQEKFALQLLYQRNAHHLQRSRGDTIGLDKFLALQNNPPNQVNMAGIPHPYFDWDDSIPDFLAQLRLDLQNWGIDPNDNVAGPPTGRDNAIGHLRAWQANLVAVNGRTAVQIGANVLNEAVGQPGNAIVKLRAVEDAWNEDWRIAGGRPI
ncbi:unnamed protein product [Rhizophagus irregularis]|nr:unnamed protein product [Rhizophagus irregularis]